MYWELRCCGGKSHILTIQHRISKIAENSLVKLGIWLPYNSSLSRSMQPRQTYSPGFTNGRTDRELRQAINPSAAMLRSGLKKVVWSVKAHSKSHTMKNRSKGVVSTAPGAKVSWGTVMIEFRSWIYAGTVDDPVVYVHNLIKIKWVIWKIDGPSSNVDGPYVFKYYAQFKFSVYFDGP